MTPKFSRRVLDAVGSDVTPLQAAANIRDGALLLDVREQPEWDAGHAPGARHIPLADVTHNLPELSGKERIVVVCRSGNRSAHAAALLCHAGLHAVNLVGGMDAWQRSNLPVVTDGGGVGHVV